MEERRKLIFFKNYKKFKYEYYENLKNCTENYCYGFPVFKDENENFKAVCCHSTNEFRRIKHSAKLQCSLLNFSSFFSLNFQIGNKILLCFLYSKIFYFFLKVNDINNIECGISIVCNEDECKVVKGFDGIKNMLFCLKKEKPSRLFFCYTKNYICISLYSFLHYFE